MRRVCGQVGADTSGSGAPAATGGNVGNGNRQTHDKVDPLNWRRLWARRTLTEVPVGCGGSAPRAHAPLVVREPETQWWAEQSRSTMTVAAVRESEAFALAGLAALAAEDELLVVLGSGRRAVQHAIVQGLRNHLPRHDIVALVVRHRHGDLLRDAARVERLLDLGSLPVVITA